MLDFKEKPRMYYAKNRPKIVSANPSIFGGTFFRASETSQMIYRRNDLWDPGPSVRPTDGYWSGNGRADSFEKDRVPVMSAAQEERVVGEVDAGAVSDGGLPDPRVHPFDFGSDGCQQEVRASDGLSGPGARWK